MVAFNDIIGEKFGKLLVLGIDEEYYNKQTERQNNGEIKHFNIKWLCKCNCGNIVSKYYKQLNDDSNCGCVDKSYAEDLTDMKFGRWTVLSRNFERTKKDKKDNVSPRTYWNCQCSCGNIEIVSAGHLKSGSSTKCKKCSSFILGETNKINYIGKNFGDLKVIEQNYKESYGKIRCFVNVECSCGNNEEILIDKIISGKITKCKKCRLEGYNTINERTMINRCKNIIKKDGSLYDDLIKKYTDEQISNFWAYENKFFPKELSKKSHRKIKLICPICKNIFISSALQIKYSLHDIMCPECFNELNCSSYQLEFNKFLEDNNIKVFHESKCKLKPHNPLTNRRLYYDNELVDYKMIVEIHGKQHYEELYEGSKWLNGKSPKEFLEYYQFRDKYKEQYALKHSYMYFVLSYKDFENDTYKEKIFNIIGRRKIE